MKTRRQALQSCGRVLKFASFPLILSIVAALPAFASPSSLAELPGAERVHAIRPIEWALLLLTILSAVTLAWWRYHRRDIASPRRIGEDLMPERGPVQLLLPLFRSRTTHGWRLGLAVALIALLGMPGEEGVFHRAKAGLTQSLRQAAWTHALAGEPVQKPWPWDGASPSASPVVPRLGLSAVALHNASGQRSEPKPFSRSWRLAMDRHEPHLAAGDVAIGDGLPVTAAEGITPAYQVTRRETLDAQGPATDASPAGASDPHLACPRHSSSFAGALRFLIEGAHIDPLASQATLHEQKL